MDKSYADTVRLLLAVAPAVPALADVARRCVARDQKRSQISFLAENWILMANMSIQKTILGGL